VLVSVYVSRKCGHVFKKIRASTLEQLADIRVDPNLTQGKVREKVEIIIENSLSLQKLDEYLVLHVPIFDNDFYLYDFKQYIAYMMHILSEIKILFSKINEQYDLVDISIVRSIVDDTIEQLTKTLENINSAIQAYDLIDEAIMIKGTDIEPLMVLNEKTFETAITAAIS
jgi:hypothetical protein